MGEPKMEGVNKNESRLNKEEIKKVFESLISLDSNYNWFVDIENNGIMNDNEEIEWIYRDITEVPDGLVNILKEKLLTKYNESHKNENLLMKWEDVSKNEQEITNMYGGATGRYLLSFTDKTLVNEFVKQLSNDEFKKISSIADMNKICILEGDRGRDPFYDTWDKRVNQDSVKKGFRLSLGFNLNQPIEAGSVNYRI